MLSREDVFAKIDELLEVGGDLVGFNGGFNPKLPLDYYCDLFASVRERYGDRVEFYALTVAEFVFLADRAGLSYAEAAARLRDAGVHWVTGGGSEILTEDFRKRHAKWKYTVADYFEAQRAIVESGMRTTATMVIGFDETLDERLEHLQRTRDFQDETEAGLFSFLCWTYKPYGTAFGGAEVSARGVPPLDRALADLPGQRQARPDLGADPERGRVPRPGLRRRRLRPADRGRGHAKSGRDDRPRPRGLLEVPRRLGYTVEYRRAERPPALVPRQGLTPKGSVHGGMNHAAARKSAQLQGQRSSSPHNPAFAGFTSTYVYVFRAALVGDDPDRVPLREEVPEAFVTLVVALRISAVEPSHHRGEVGGGSLDASDVVRSHQAVGAASKAEPRTGR